LTIKTMKIVTVPASATLLAAFVLGLAPACLNAGSPAISWPQIGAKAGANYQGDGLTVVATAQGARLRCVFQRLEGEATCEGLWLTSSAGNGGPNRFRVVAAAVGRKQVPAERGASESGSLESCLSASDCETARLPQTGTVAIDGQTVRFTRPGIVEEYSVSMDGVRQDFLMMERPAGAGEMAVRLAVTGARVEPVASGARLVLDNSGRKLAYCRFRAADATG
jgi:hypothetical protein